MDEMDYEFLIRQAYNCGRTEKYGADADIYRSMERSQSVMNDPLWSKSQSEKEYDFRVKFSKVRNHVHKAIEAGMKKIQCSDDEKTELNTILKALNFHFYDKAKLDEFIQRVSDIFSKHGLEA